MKSLLERALDQWDEIVTQRITARRAKVEAHKRRGEWMDSQYNLGYLHGLTEAKDLATTEVIRELAKETA